MQTAGFLNQNGKILKAGKPLISPDNRSFRYGDGCFETIKMMHGKIILENYHFERLFSSIETLQFERPAYFKAAYLKELIVELAKKNNHQKLARIRLMIFRGNGGLYDAENHFPNYLIQTYELNPANNELNENGLVVDIYKHSKKVCDDFSHIKSNNYLPYVMAAIWAKQNKLNDAILLNSHNHIADATIANIFIVKDGIIKTPAITEGCVGGVMRRHLLKCFSEENIPVEETKIKPDELSQASEIFLSNGISGIRWVKQLAETNYKNTLSKMLHQKFISTLYA